jgi:hypothetical protein
MYGNRADKGGDFIALLNQKSVQGPFFRCDATMFVATGPRDEEFV